MHANRSKARELRLLELANSQSGLLRHTDLTGERLARGAIADRLSTSRLTRLHHHVYTFGHSAITRQGTWLAAMWACGDGAVLSHVSAAAFHGMLDEENTAPVHISTTGKVRSREGIVVHRLGGLRKVDIFSPHPLLVTHIPRTLVDLADVLPWDEYRAVADNLPKLRLDTVKEAQQRAPGRRGAPLVTRLIEADDAHTKSEFERRFLRFSRAHSLPRPDDLNCWIAGHKADCHYVDERLVIELDGRAHHKRRAQMRADRQRDTDYQVLRPPDPAVGLGRPTSRRGPPNRRTCPSNARRGGPCCPMHAIRAVGSTPPTNSGL